MLVTAFVTASFLFAAEPVRWDDTPSLAGILAASRAALGEHLVVDGLRDGEAPRSAACAADVMRPATGSDAPVVDPNAGLRCDLTYDDGGTASLGLSLAETPVHFWGNRFDRHKPFSIKGDVAAALYDALAAARASGDPLTDDMGICGPDGRVCLTMVSLNRHAVDESPSALICSHEYEDGILLEVECVFQPRL